MNTLIQNKKKILLTAASFLFALVMIHFEAGKYLFKLQVNNKPEPNAAGGLNNTANGVFTTKGESVPVIISNYSNSHNAVAADESQEAIESDYIGAVKPNLALATKSSKFYLHQISTVSHMLIKFSQKLDYSAELGDLDQSNVPLDVKQVLDDMQGFATKYMLLDEKKTQIFPKEGVLDRIVGHFVQIEKLPDSYKNKNEKYEELRKKLYIVEDYFYSQKFLDEAIGHD